MGHRDDFNHRIEHTVNYAVRKAAQHVFSCAVHMPRPLLRIIADRADGVIERHYESISGGWTSFRVPEKGRSRFGYGVRMEVNAWKSHEIVGGFGAAPRTRERSLRFPYLTRRSAARSPYSTPLPHPRLPNHPSFRSDDRQARHALPQADATLLRQFFCELASSKKFYNSLAHQNKFRSSEAVWS